MRFTSIREVIEKTNANAKAAECLGKSGAFNNLEEDLNELEAAEYAREIVSFLREEERYEERLQKYEENIRNKEDKFRKKVEERRIKQETREEKYRERLSIWQKKATNVAEENAKRRASGRKLLKEPKKPADIQPLKEIDYPKLPDEPVQPVQPGKPRVMLSSRERIRLQREILNVYLSGHPLDEVPEKKDVTEIKNLAETEENTWCTIRGVLQSIKVTNTRKKQLMGRLRIEDKSGSIEVVAFPKLYESLRGVLIEGELYEILGRVDITKRESSEGNESTHIQFIGTKVKPIRVGSDKEWDVMYPLLKGNLHILPGRIQKSKGLATTIILQSARKTLEGNVG